MSPPWRRSSSPFLDFWRGEPASSTGLRVSGIPEDHRACDTSSHTPPSDRFHPKERRASQALRGLQSIPFLNTGVSMQERITAALGSSTRRSDRSDSHQSLVCVEAGGGAHVWPVLSRDRSWRRAFPRRCDK
jgi:hypothetical protein